MADWNAVENALATWVGSYSGLSAGSTVWAHHNTRRPDGTFIDLLLGEIVSVTAQDEMFYIDHTGDLTPPISGQEIEEQVRAVREFGLTIQVFAPPSGGPAEPRGSSGPRAILAKLQTSIALPAVVGAFDAVGISCVDLGSIRYLPEIVGTAFEARASLELRFYVTDTASEFTGYIDAVDINDPTDPGTPDTSNGTIDI